MILTTSQKFKMFLVPYYGRNVDYPGSLYGWKDGKLIEVDKMYLRYQEERGEADLFLRPFIVSSEKISKNEECLFVIKDGPATVAFPDDLLGDQIEEVYRIVVPPDLIGIKRTLDYFGDNHISYTFDPLKASDIQKILENQNECHLMLENYWETGMEHHMYDVVFVDRKVIIT